MGRSTSQRVLLALAAAIVIVAAVLLLDRGYHGYTARVVLADAGGLQQGSNVQVGGVTEGRVSGLYVNRHDRAVAIVQLDHSAVPLGAGAQATVQIDGFFGERELLLTRGNYRAHPERSGYTVPVSDSNVSVRLDDVIDTLNPDAQGALQIFLDEQGKALVGRGGDLGATLAELPQTLPALTTLMGQLSANQQALGDLVARSDRVVAQVAAQRTHLGAFINSANGALGALAGRRTQLGETVRSAPATLTQARATLASLEGAAVPLAPAADGLRATAPSLTAALHEIPQFATAAVPTLNEVSRVSPQLQRLADVATPVVRALVPLTSQLTGYSSQGLAPLTTLLDNRGGAAGLFGEMEGWARSTQGYDASSHIFRFGATVSPASFKQLLALMSLPGLTAQDRSNHPAPASHTAGHSPSSTAPPTAAASPPTSTAGSPPPPASAPPSATGLLGKTVGTVGQTVASLLGGSGAQPQASAGGQTGSSLSSLLNYLLGK